MLTLIRRLYRSYRQAQRLRIKRERRRVYQEYLQSAKWRKKRRERLVIAGGRCEYRQGWYRCKAVKGLHCHHLNYRRFGDEDVARDLMILCKFHHGMVHGRRVGVN